MLFHLVPKIYVDPRFHLPRPVIVDLAIPEWSLHLVGGEDVTHGRPYPNKNYTVACRKVGRKSMDGILIQTSAVVDSFHLVARWAVGTEVLTHNIRFDVADHLNDAASSSMVLWPNHPCIRLKSHTGSPASTEPRMDAVWADLTTARKEGNSLTDIVGEFPLNKRRDEVFELPTITSDRILAAKYFGERIPPLQDAFNITSVGAQ